jgi:hypothetical protein
MILKILGVVIFLLSWTSFAYIGYGKYVMKCTTRPLWLHQPRKINIYFVLSIVSIVCSLFLIKNILWIIGTVTMSIFLGSFISMYLLGYLRSSEEFIEQGQGSYKKETDFNLRNFMYCSLCGSNLPSKKHYRTHKISGEKQYLCEECWVANKKWYKKMQNEGIYPTG